MALTMEEVLGSEDAQEVTTQTQEQEAQATQEQETQETPATTEDVAPVEQEEPKYVPLPALHEARAEIKALKDQLATVSQLRSELERFRGEYYTRQQMQQQAQTQPKVPDFETDPIGHLQAKIDNQNNVIRQLATFEMQRVQQSQQNEHMSKLATHVAAEVGKFKSSVPDYDDAYNFVRDVRLRELQALGISNPLHIEQHLNDAAAGLTISALQNNRNPGEALYNLAKSYGYQSKGTRTNTDLGTVQQGIQNASRTMSKGGGNVEVDPTFDSLMNANSPEEFSKQWNKIFSKQINK